MTCSMAAGRQKKRLTSSNLLEQYIGKKKKKLDSVDYLLNLRSNIYLEWDDTQKRVVAKREQVGMTWVDMAPFVDSVPHSRSGLADVLSVPQEIFDLENLTEVLSYEVWATCLSESERKLLTQFLPSGTGAEQVVHSLVKGENHHFGNPYLKWSASLCSGKLHPDVVLRTKQQCRANRKAYNSEISKYHTGMIEVFKKWKERCITCKDPEKFWSEGFTKHKQETLPFSAERVKAAPISKKEMPHEICIHHSDVAKYLSYIKISQKQLELVKNIKQSGDGIQFKSLSRVLGDIKGFHVQPFEIFEEEEKNRLHDHWLRLATKDLPVSFEECRNKKLKREQWVKSLAQELAEKKLIINKDKETEDLESSPQEHVDDGDSEYRPTDVLDQEAVDSTPNSTHDHHLERIPSLNSHQEFSPMVLGKAAVRQDILKPIDNSPHLPQFFGMPDPAEDVIEPKASISSAKDMWQAVPIRDSYDQNTSECCGYMPSGELSLRQPQFTKELPAHVIDLERDTSEQEAGEFVATALHMDSGASLLCSYSNQGHNELPPHFPKGSRTLSSYPHGHMNSLKQPELRFLMANDSLSPSGPFSQQFQEQQRLLEQRQVREKELYMHQMYKNVFSNGRYPSPGNFLSVEQQGWAALPSPVNGRLVGHNWLPDHNGANNGWSGGELASSGGHCFSNGSSGDGSLFSVLSQCKKQPSHLPYDATSSEQSMQSRNYNDDIYAYAPHQLKIPSSLGTATTPFWTSASGMNFPHQNPSMCDSTGRTFMRSWNR